MEFKLGKVKLDILQPKPGDLLVEYELDGHTVQESVSASKFLEHVEDLRDSLREFEDKRKLQEEARSSFDAGTAEKLESMGIRDFTYLTRGTRDED